MLISAIQNPIQSNAVNYDEPVQYIQRESRASFTGGTIVNDWREYQWTRSSPTDAVNGSFTFSAYAVDYYGENFDVWVSIYLTGGGQNDTKIYDRGWTTETMSNLSLPTTIANGRDIKVIFRWRYSSDSQNPNPPANSMYGALRFWLNWDEAVNYNPTETTALPADWVVTTTQTTPDYPAEILTTTTYYDMSNFDTFSQNIRYNLATIFGIADSGADITRVMNYIDTKTQYASAIISFCLICGCVVECLKW